MGKWLGCVALDKDDWLVCGGGPRLSLWHLRSLAITTVFDTPGSAPNHAMFHEDQAQTPGLHMYMYWCFCPFNDCRDFLLQIISAGNESCVRHWTINGELKLQVPCSQTNVFNVEINDKTECHKVGSVSLCSGVTFVRFE